MLSQVATLTKWRIALLSAVSAVAGAMLAAPDPGLRLWLPVIGTYLLACGAGALNQIQERDIDGRMERTRHRPLPTGTMSVRTVAIIVAGFLGAGLTVLALTGHWLAVLFGIGAVLAYNALYTPLKRVTPWAPVIGAVVGAFAPAIGWTGVGGAAFRPSLVGLIVFFVVWQIPHFWLLFLRAERDFAAAGLPVLTDRLDPVQLKRVTLVWILSATTLGLLLPLLGAIRHIGLFLLLVGTAFWLGWRARGVLTAGVSPAEGRTFAAINGFALAILVLIIVDQAWGGAL
jgi:protoheme IX farnesyltransferase